MLEQSLICSDVPPLPLIHSAPKADSGQTIEKPVAGTGGKSEKEMWGWHDLNIEILQELKLGNHVRFGMRGCIITRINQLVLSRFGIVRSRSKHIQNAQSMNINSKGFMMMDE